MPASYIDHSGFAPKTEKPMENRFSELTTLTMDTKNGPFKGDGRSRMWKVKASEHGCCIHILSTSTEPSNT